MPQLKVRIGCVVLAVIMSAVTYYFVEPKLRWGRYGGFKAAGLLCVMVIIGVAGDSIERHDGYTARMNDPEQPVIDAVNSRLEDDFRRCLESVPDFKAAASWEMVKCRFQRAPGKNTIAVIGDSHAGHLYAGLMALSRDSEGIAVFPAACAVPLIGLQSWGSHTKNNTERILARGFDYILNHKNITKVVLSHAPGCSWHDVVDTKNPGNHDFDSIMHDGFVRTYDILTKAGKEIYVVMDNPHNPWDMWSKCKEAVVRRPVAIPDFLSSKSVSSCTVKLSDMTQKKERDNWEKVSRETADGYKNVHFIDLKEVFCNKNGICPLLDRNGKLMFLDKRSHLDTAGSIYAAQFIFEKLRE